MRAFLLVAIFAVCGTLPAAADEAEEFNAQMEVAKVERDALFKEISDKLPKEGQRSKSAKLELEHWYRHNILFGPHSRKFVKTTDGKNAEVVFLTEHAMSMPGTDVSMAFLLVENRIVDWASCSTYNRTARQELLLEDVDGDGLVDVAFRASKGWWGLVDKRQHSFPGSGGKWLYAYAITDQGFQSLFPNTARKLKIQLAYKAGSQSVLLEVKGLPEPLEEYQLVECTISAKNTSDKDLAIKTNSWFQLEAENAGYHMHFGPGDNRAVLKPGETVSQSVRLRVHGARNDELTLTWKFSPEESE